MSTENPFDVIEKRLSGIEALLNQIKYAPIPTQEPLPDRIPLNEACEHTGLSKSKIYKMSMLDEIPVAHYGKRLVFSRKALNEWMENRTISKNPVPDLIADSLQKSAKKKLQ